MNTTQNPLSEGITPNAQSFPFSQAGIPMSELDQSKVAKILKDIDVVKRNGEITHLCVNPQNYYINCKINTTSNVIIFEGFFDKHGLNTKIPQ